MMNLYKIKKECMDVTKYTKYLRHIQEHHVPTTLTRHMSFSDCQIKVVL